MFQAKLIIGLRCFLLKFVDEPNVFIRGEEELAGDLVHVVLASDAAALLLLQLLFNLLVLLFTCHVHSKGSLAEHLIRVTIDVKEVE